MTDRTLGLFEAVGIELEYMIVDRETLAVRPIADELLHAVGGGYDQEVELGDVAWSNELALHVIEMKTNGPTPDLSGLGALFHEHVGRIDALLEPMGARLMPTAMHPWMDPERELRLWPHENDVVYQTFHRIFDCRGHGWANLQSMHINLPFSGDAELARLHAAIRVVLPLLPALAASSPYVEGRASGQLDTRMAVYRTNARRVPSVSGLVVPEHAASREEYEAAILDRIYRDLAPLDPEGVLRHEWVNARGCIARFDRSALEIRVLDLQEHPGADIAVAGAVSAVVRAMAEERFAGLDETASWDTGALANILGATIDHGDRARLDSPDYLRLFGYPERGPALASDLWQHLVETTVAQDPAYPEWRAPLAVLLEGGCLARRLLESAGAAPHPDRLREVYGELCACLREGRAFEADAP